MLPSGQCNSGGITQTEMEIIQWYRECVCSGPPASGRHTIHRPRDLCGARVPFPWCASLKPLFAAAVAAPWGSSKGFIISKAYMRLAHAVISPWSTCENCSLIVLGSGDVPIPWSLQAEWGRLWRSELKMELSYPKSCELCCGFLRTGYFSRVSAEVLRAVWLLVPLWN